MLSPQVEEHTTGLDDTEFNNGDRVAEKNGSEKQVTSRPWNHGHSMTYVIPRASGLLSPCGNSGSMTAQVQSGKRRGVVPFLMYEGGRRNERWKPECPVGILNSHLPRSCSFGSRVTHPDLNS